VVERLNWRRLDPEEVRLTVVAPEFVVQSVPPRRFHMRRYTDVGTGKTMLLRVAIEETDTELVVLTVYRTSKLQKYLKGLI
jgi:hypothetical protein